MKTDDENIYMAVRHKNGVEPVVLLEQVIDEQAE